MLLIPQFLGTAGMEGAGEIYEWYKDGTCIDDADVAVAHTEGNYDSVSVPIVNLIATVNALNDKSLINIIEDCRRIYYPERSWGKIKNVFGTETHDLLKSNYINQKSLDTVKAIELSKTYPAVKRERSIASLLLTDSPIKLFASFQKLYLSSVLACL